jgi:hypothetical protein
LIKSNESKEEESSQKFKDEVLSFIKFRENAPPISCNNKFLSAEEKKSKLSLLVHNFVEVQTHTTLKTMNRASSAMGSKKEDFEFSADSSIPRRLRRSPERPSISFADSSQFSDDEP